ncbi:MAG: hypothetical protein CMM04_16995 [Rhodopirellula sp.]|nr:hypothetical protein [Rhodopirellula sp.]MBE76108.1 hypothetical protein [Rhodopirellula sp.]|tara:strand:+ start:1457 stop:1687 length:231 start_codon:yes stop_codon:yes gene_type:complete
MKLWYKRLSDKEHYTKKEVLEKWGLSESKLSDIVKSENIKVIKFGKLNYYKGKELNIYWDKLFSDKTFKESLENKN